ncbi:hypothetical protein ACA910_000622 [Epithemia clementina (nom. ined.)]
MSPNGTDSAMIDTGQQGHGDNDITTSETSTINATQRVDPNGRNNNLVAESDYHAALNVFSQRAKRSVKEERDSSVALLKQKVFESMANYLSRVVVTPVSDADFNMYCSEMENQHKRRLHQRGKQSQETDAKMEEDSRTLDDSIIEFDISDFEKDELLDAHAMDRVRDLRKKVREQAHQVASVRNGVLNKANTVAQEQMKRILLRPRRSKDECEMDNDREDQQQVQRREVEAAILDMRRALQRTKANLHSAETKLPALLDKWERQMEALQESERWNLSQTEQVLRTTTKDNILPEPGNATAEDRFRRLLNVKGAEEDDGVYFKEY